MADKPLLSAHVLFNDKRLTTLLGFYKAATKKLTSELNNVTDFGRASRISTLKQIDGILQTLDQKTSDWFKKEVEDYYRQYGKEALQQLTDDGFPVTATFGLIDQEAVKTLTDNIMGYYREAYSGVKRSAMRMLNEAAKMRVTAILAEGKISGETRRQISDRISGMLKEGFVALIDRGGRRWNIESYANMLTRTMLVRTANQGIINRLGNSGYDLVQITDHYGECPLCRPWEGKVLSLSGTHPTYPSVDKAMDSGEIFHPNCRHRLVPYHEKLAEVSAVWNADKQRYIGL